MLAELLLIGNLSLWSGSNFLPPMSADPRPQRRLLRGLAAMVAILALFYAVAGYLGSADMFGAHPRWRGMNKGPRDFGLSAETVSFESTDGIHLKAWWLPASRPSRAAVIIAHGIDHTRQVMLPRAAFLVAAGYNVLLPDLRGHGESGGSIVSPGFLEARDILGGIRYIRSRRDNEPIGLLGLSYGAVASLIATAESPAVAAVISDGAFVSGKQLSEDISRHYLQNSRTNPFLRALFLVSSVPGVAGATSLVYYLRSGTNLGPDLLSVLPWASRLGQRTVRHLGGALCASERSLPVLAISGGRDWIAPTSGACSILAAIPGNRKELLVIPGAVHDTTYSTSPELYGSTVLSFLAKYVSLR